MNKAHRPSAPSDMARGDAVVSCWMCGICTHSSQMMPDGGSACDDIRWYCNDARACTQRWTTSHRTLAQTSASEVDGGNDTETRADSQADWVGTAAIDASRSA